jgi:predicted nucleic acid-binding protein
MVLIDTSAWLFALRKNFHPVIKTRIERLLVESDVAINGMIELELLGGTRSEKEYDRLKKRLEGLYYIKADRSLWEVSSRLAFDLKKKGLNLPYTDIFIAASSLKEKAVLIHADSHFDLIAKHSNIEVESFVSLIND